MKTTAIITTSGKAPQKTTHQHEIDVNQELDNLSDNKNTQKNTDGEALTTITHTQSTTSMVIPTNNNHTPYDVQVLLTLTTFIDYYHLED